MAVIPLINKEPQEVWEAVLNKINTPESQRKLVLVIVCIALLLDNMLYMVIVPIIPIYLRGLNSAEYQQERMESEDIIWNNYTYAEVMHIMKTNETLKEHLFPLVTYHGDKSEDATVGILFASKAIVQLLVNPLSGTFIDRMGYDIPMVIGLVIIFFSTVIFAFGKSYGILFMARSLQGLGSAFADTSGLAMIADRYTEENSRQKAMAIALAFISFGCLFAPPFGGLLYEAAGKALPFVLLAFIALVDGIMIMFVMKPVRKQKATLKAAGEAVKGTPIYRLILDPYIALCAGSLVMANVSLAFLEPTIAIWMKDTMKSSEWEMGIIWLPAFFPHVLGVVFTVKMQRMFPSKQWIIIAVGLCLEGFSCLLVPFCTNYIGVIFPLMIDCFGIAMVDTAVLPTLGYLVDTRYTSVYGSVYAIADISYCLAYAFGPIVAGSIVQSIGFTWLNIGIFISNIAYAPLLFFLRHIYKYKQFEEDEEDNEDLGLTGNSAGQQYKTYMMNNITGTTEKDGFGDGSNNHYDQNHTTQKQPDNITYNNTENYTRKVYSRHSTDSESEGYKAYH